MASLRRHGCRAAVSFGYFYYHYLTAWQRLEWGAGFDGTFKAWRGGNPSCFSSDLTPKPRHEPRKCLLPHLQLNTGTGISSDGPGTLKTASSAFGESSTAPMGAGKSSGHRVRGGRGLCSAKPLVWGSLSSTVCASTLRDRGTPGLEAARLEAKARPGGSSVWCGASGSL